MNSVAAVSRAPHDSYSLNAVTTPQNQFGIGSNTVDFGDSAFESMPLPQSANRPIIMNTRSSRHSCLETLC